MISPCKCWVILSVTSQIKFSEAKEKFGREIRIFETVPATSSAQTTLPENGSCNILFFLLNPPIDQLLSNFLFKFCTDEADEFYQFSAEDYYRIMSTKKEGNIL